MAVRRVVVCLVLFLSVVLASSYVWPAASPLPRYDFLVVVALVIQAAMLAFKLEKPFEALVIFWSATAGLRRPCAAAILRRGSKLAACDGPNRRSFSAPVSFAASWSFSLARR